MEKPAVLLLERNATVIEVAQRCLADEAELHVANTLDLALKIAARREIKVGVLDAAMAGSTPGDTVQKLRALRPGMRVVFLADPAFDLDRRYGALGAMLRKPLTPERFTDAVRNALRLSGMSAGVQRMRTSSGTFPAVHIPDPLPPPATLTRAHPPASPSSPPAAAEGPDSERTENRESGTTTRESSPGGETRRVTPPPFARVR